MRVIDSRTDIFLPNIMNTREILAGEKHEKDNPIRYICRTCLKTLELGEPFTFVNDFSKVEYFENLRISYMIEKSVPELDLDIIYSPIICDTCYKMLWYTYLFKLRCFQTEEKIFAYLEKNKLNIGDKIDIQKLRDENSVEQTIINYNVTTVDDINVQTGDVICISDSESMDDGDNDDSNCREKKEGEEEIAGCDAVGDSCGVADVPMNGKSSIDQKNVFPCQQCNYKGSRLDLLKRHVKNCHATKDMKIYNCHVCLYTTFRKSNLRRHELVHGGVQPFICGICERTFTERRMLKDHMYKHSGKPLSFRCGEVGCKAAFARECDLSVHIVSHMNYSPNICQGCYKAFLTKDQLERHKHKYKH